MCEAQNDLSPNAFVILQSAVSLARYEEVRCVDTLRRKLQCEYPNNHDDVESALKFWGNSIASRGRPSRFN